MLSPQLLELLRAWWREERRRSLLLSAATRRSRYRPGSATAFPVPEPSSFSLLSGGLASLVAGLWASAPRDSSRL